MENKEMNINVDSKDFVVKKCPSYPVLFITKDGNFVFKKTKNKYVSLSISIRRPSNKKRIFDNPYKVIAFKNPTNTTVGIHILVADAWIGPKIKIKGKKISVSHEDGNFLNNEVENLCYVDSKENTSFEILRKYGKEISDWVRLQKRFVNTAKTFEEKINILNGIDRRLKLEKATNSLKSIVK